MLFQCIPHHATVSIRFWRLNELNNDLENVKLSGANWREFRVISASATVKEASNYISAAPILLPDGPWKQGELLLQKVVQIPGGVTAAKGFKAAGIYGGLRAVREKPELALVTCDVEAISAGAFTTNVVAAAPVLYCKKVLEFQLRETCLCFILFHRRQAGAEWFCVFLNGVGHAVLTNAGQANAAMGDAGYQDVIECSNSLGKLLGLKPGEVLINSTGVIGQRIKKEALLGSLPRLVSLLSSTIEGADSGDVEITTTDLVSKSVAIESEIEGICVRVRGMAKGCGMMHPNMATVITTDACVRHDIWRKMVQVSVSQSFNQITVDGYTSTNDTVLALASGPSGLEMISSLNNSESEHLQLCLDAVLQCLAKSIAWDGEGAKCLIEVKVNGAYREAETAKIARSVASSSLSKAAVYGRDPNWGHIACAAVLCRRFV